MFLKFVVLLVATLGAAAAADGPTARAVKENAAADNPPIRVVEEIAAKVNGDIITRGELAEKHKEIEAAMAQDGLTGARLADAVREKDVDSLRDEIDTLLLVQKGKEMTHLSVDADVTRYFNDLQVRAKINDPEKFREWLRAQSGMSYDELKDRKKKELMAQRVVSYEVMSRISVPQAELQKYYDEHKPDFVREEAVFLSQILISTEGKTPEQAASAEAKAKDVAARAKKGEKFGDLAREFSDDPATAENGGYLGTPSRRGTLRPDLEAIVFKEKKGFVSDPIKLTAPPAFLILKVEEHFEAGQASFEEVQEDVHDKVVGPRMIPKVREYLTQLRQNAFLQIKDSYVDSGAAPGKDTRWQEVAMLRPPTTTKEEVSARVKPHKKILFVPIPGTTAKAKPVEEAKAKPAEDLQPANIAPPKPPSVKKTLPAAAPVAPIKQ